ncbi:MAG TPA: IPT/TIG domain-containing protein [Pyrinomonadaceae bacterium]|nr:IPT/TIG domain-containing protein [Pyrinomonadaceae bacterium]
MSKNAADGSSGDGSFAPDPPVKVKFYQVILLFVYHVALAIVLAYSIYNVWPPQPWPGDRDDRAAANSNQRGANTAGAAAANNATNANTATNANVANADTAANASAANANAVRNANASNSNTGGGSAGGGGTTDADGAGRRPADPPTDAVEAAANPYGDQKPPPFTLFGRDFRPALETRLILIVLLAGAIGSYIHAASSFVDYLGNRTLVSSWVWWYLLRPFIGMMLALLFYFVFRGGFITAGVNQGGEGAASFINPFGIAAVAGLVGMFSKVAADKLNEVFTTLFRSKEGDEKRGDKLYANLRPDIAGIAPAVGPAAGGTAVTIRGADFMEGAAVTFGGVGATAVVVRSATSLTAITPAHAAGAVDVEVLNPNKQRDVLEDGFTYQ